MIVGSATLVVINYYSIKTTSSVRAYINGMTIGTVAVLAQDPAPAATPTPAPSTEYQQGQDKDMQSVAVTDLPANIQASLQGQDYSGWTVANAHKKEKDGKAMYVVELKNGAETKKVKFDADGNVVKEKEKSN